MVPMKLILLLLLSFSAFAEDHEYFALRVSADQLRAFGLPGVDTLARDYVQVFVKPQKSDTRRMVATMQTRRNGVDRTYALILNVGDGTNWPVNHWVPFMFEVDQVFVNLEVVSISFDEFPEPLVSSTAKAPLRMIR